MGLCLSTARHPCSLGTRLLMPSHQVSDTHLSWEKRVEQVLRDGHEALHRAIGALHRACVAGRLTVSPRVKAKARHILTGQRRASVCLPSFTSQRPTCAAPSPNCCAPSAGLAQASPSKGLQHRLLLRVSWQPNGKLALRPACRPPLQSQWSPGAGGVQPPVRRLFHLLHAGQPPASALPLQEKWGPCGMPRAAGGLRGMY